MRILQNNDPVCNDICVVLLGCILDMFEVPKSLLGTPPPCSGDEVLNFNPNVEIITDILLEDVQIAMRVFKIIKFYRIKILRGHHIGDTYSRWVTNRQTDIQTFRCTGIHVGHVGSYI